jgi:DNA-directed RNA polymerase beta' subunit
MQKNKIKGLQILYQKKGVCTCLCCLQNSISSGKTAFSKNSKVKSICSAKKDASGNTGIPNNKQIPNTGSKSLTRNSKSTIKAEKDLRFVGKPQSLTISNTTALLATEKQEMQSLTDFVKALQDSTKLPNYTPYSTLDEIRLVTVSLATPKRIRQWAEKTLPNGKVVGEVTNSDTLNHRTFKPQKGGLFCERIFGPLKDYECACGGTKNDRKKASLLAFKNAVSILDKSQNNISTLNSLGKITKMSNLSSLNVTTQKSPFGQINDYQRFFCSKCDVEYTWSVMRRYQLGYIQLNAPVTHVWYVKGTPSYISILLDIKRKHLEKVIYCVQSFTLEKALFSNSAFGRKDLFITSPEEDYELWKLTLDSISQNGPQKISLVPKANSNTKHKNWYYCNTIATFGSNVLRSYAAVGSGKTTLIKNSNFDKYSRSYKGVRRKTKGDNPLINQKANNYKAFFSISSATKKVGVLTSKKTTQSDANLTMENNGGLWQGLCPRFDNTSPQTNLQNPLYVLDLDKKEQLGLRVAKINPKAVLHKLKSKKQSYARILGLLSLSQKNKKKPKVKKTFLNTYLKSYSKEAYNLANTKSCLRVNNLLLNISTKFKFEHMEPKRVLNLFQSESQNLGIYAYYLVHLVKLRKLKLKKYQKMRSVLSSIFSDKLKKLGITGSKHLSLDRTFQMSSAQSAWKNSVVKQGVFKNSNKKFISNKSLAKATKSTKKTKNILKKLLLTINNNKSLGTKLWAKLTSNKKLLQWLSSGKIGSNVFGFGEKINRKKQTLGTSLARTKRKPNLGKIARIVFIKKKLEWAKKPTSFQRLQTVRNSNVKKQKTQKDKKRKTRVGLLMHKKIQSLILLNKFLSLFKDLDGMELCSVLNSSSKYMEQAKSMAQAKKTGDLSFSTLWKNASTDRLIPEVSYAFKYLQFYKNQKKKGSKRTRNTISDVNTWNFVHPSYASKKQIKHHQNDLKHQTKVESVEHYSKKKLDFLLNVSKVPNVRFSDLLDVTQHQSIVHPNRVNNKGTYYQKRSAIFNSTNSKKLAKRLNYFVKPGTGMTKNSVAFITSPGNPSKQSSKSPSKYVNNMYCLSHRDLWASHSDWVEFARFVIAPVVIGDTTVPAYNYRLYDFTYVSTLFTGLPTDISAHELSPGITSDRSSIPSSTLTQHNLNSVISGAGIIQALLSEFDFVELKKMDKQNRMLLYEINKYIRLLKKCINDSEYGESSINNVLLKIIEYMYPYQFIPEATAKPMSQEKENETGKKGKAKSTDSKDSQEKEINVKKIYKEICTKRDALLRRTKMIRKIIINSAPTFLQNYPLKDFLSINREKLRESNSTLENPSPSKPKATNKNVSDTHPVYSVPSTAMVLHALPVIPPDLRPIVKMGTQIAAVDLNRLYQRVMYRNARLKKFLKDPATNGQPEMKYAQRLLQEAVDNLIHNGKSGVKPEKDARGRVLKSLTDLLKGKQGRFRQFLLGKRVDYSGRSVIVVGPKLKLHECGIPKEMALELFLPLLIKFLLSKNYVKTILGAKALIHRNKSLTWSVLREIMKTCPVLLNRAPTLHRLGFQAFQPKLVDGRAILLHPLVCPSFNADFDGDQMAVHVPLTPESRTEAWKLMLARNNLLSPATGEPIILPSQDMVLGCYYLTTFGNTGTQQFEKGYGLFFNSLNDVLCAYNQGLLSIHAIVWVKWNGILENPQGGSLSKLEQPIEIRLNQNGYTRMIFSKKHTVFDLETLNRDNPGSLNLVKAKVRSSIHNKKQTISKQRPILEKKYTIIRTTPGKILFNTIIQSTLSGVN